MGGGGGGEGWGGVFMTYGVNNPSPPIAIKQDGQHWLSGVLIKLPSENL